MTYEYECMNPTCKHTWEAEQKITAEPMRECPRCGQQKAKRLISQGAFILNGEGWARDGY